MAEPPVDNDVDLNFRTARRGGITFGASGSSRVDIDVVPKCTPDQFVAFVLRDGRTAIASALQLSSAELKAFASTRELPIAPPNPMLQDTLIEAEM